MYAITWCYMAALLVWSGLVWMDMPMLNTHLPSWQLHCTAACIIFHGCSLYAMEPDLLQHSTPLPAQNVHVCINQRAPLFLQCSRPGFAVPAVYYPYRVALQHWEPPPACSANSHRQHASLLLSLAQPTSAAAAGCHEYCVSMQYTALLPAQTFCSCQAASINSLSTSPTSLVCCCSLSSTSSGVAAYNATTTQGSSLLLPRGVWACWQIP